MSEIWVDEARPAELARWDHFVENSLNGSIFHLRSFLAYHGNRFEGRERFLVVRKNDGVIAQIAMAVQEEGGRTAAVSPYGASVGGFVLAQTPGYSQGSRIAAAFVDYLSRNHIHSVRLTLPPAFHATESLDTFSFNLMEVGFRSINRDITSVVPLDRRSPLSERARRKMRKAQEAGMTIEHRADLQDFWPLMEATYAKHGVRPTHSRSELALLMECFPNRIFASIAWAGDRPVAGICFFAVNPRVMLSFYSCQDPGQPDLPGLGLLLPDAIDRFREQGFRWLDLGTSTVSMQPRPSLFQFKEGYGRTGFFRETLTWTA
jgi:hypothetical protein